MLAMIGSLAIGVEASRGLNVWAVLCRTALRGIDWAAKACGVNDGENRVERAELLMTYGIAPEPPAVAPRASLDWAKLDEFDRGRVSREFRGEPR